MKSKIIAVLITSLAVVFITGSLNPEETERRIIKPLKKGEALIVSNIWWAVSELSETDQKLIKSSYVQGFWDALTLVEAETLTIKGVRSFYAHLSADYEGMDISQIVDTMDKFYQDNPQWRNISPSTVMVVVIPRLRKGLSPLPPSENK